MLKKSLPMTLQLFAEGGAGAGQGAASGGENAQQPPAEQTQAEGRSSGGQQPAFDYEKLAGIISGKQKVTEDTILKNYFSRQGLSQEEAAQAIAGFKEAKAKNTPDVNALRTQLAQAKEAAQAAAIEKEAALEAVAMGLDAKAIPYVLKLADMKGVTDSDGKINQENLKKALNKVLEDVPQFKASQSPQGQPGAGFQIGSNGGQSNNLQEQLDSIFGIRN